MSLRQKIYFSITKYFQFFANRNLKKWKPIIIAVVGSAGKTTTMSFINQILSAKIKVKVSNKTNAASAIPLNILGLKQSSFSIWEWLKLVFVVPLRTYVKHEENIYLCEMDTDQQDEMKLHTRLINPDICCWLSATPTHTQNFKGINKEEIEQAMLNDMMLAAKKTKSLLLANNDDKNINSLVKNLTINKILINLENPDSPIFLQSHKIDLTGTTVIFRFDKNVVENLLQKPLESNVVEVKIPLAIVSKINMYGLAMAIFLGFSFDLTIRQIQNALKDFRLPPGRMSLFAGKKATTIIDSSYNSSRLAATDALQTLKILGKNKTLAILGDMRELGDFSQIEHENLAREIVRLKIDRLILVGPMMAKFTLPVLLTGGYEKDKTVFALSPKEALDLVNNPDFLQIGETILIKGSQNTLFLEEIVESLLASPKDKQFLCRREKMWEKEREKTY